MARLLATMFDRTYVSEDGINWRLGATGVGSLTQAAYGNGVYLGSSGGTAVRRSVDRMEWSSPIALGGTSFALAFTGSRFISLSSAGMVRLSEDGLTWDSVHAGVGNNLRGLAHQDGTIIAVGESGVMTVSHDEGETWTPKATGTTNNLWYVAGGDGKWLVALGSNNYLISEDNGETWGTLTNPYGSMSAVYYEEGVFVGQTGTGIVYSLNGHSWGSIANSRGLSGIAYADGVWVVCAYYGSSAYMYYSEDGASWTSRTISDFVPRSLIYSPSLGLWIVGGYKYSDGTTGRIATAPHLPTTWTFRASFPSANDLYQLLEGEPGAFESVAVVPEVVPDPIVRWSKSEPTSETYVSIKVGDTEIHNSGDLGDTEEYDLHGVVVLTPGITYTITVSGLALVDNEPLISSVYEWTVPSGPYKANGTFETEPIHLGRGDGAASGTVTWTEKQRTTSTITAEYATSPDGDVWSDYEPIDNGGLVPPTEYLKLRFTLTRGTGPLDTPEITSISVAYPEEYVAEGYWTQELDLRDVVPDSIDLELEFDEPEGTKLTPEYRTKYSDDDWTEWETVPEEGIPSSEIRHYLQVRVKFESNTGTHDRSPRLFHVKYKVTSDTTRGIWTSQAVDVSQAKDKTTGKVSSEIALGQVFTQFRYSTDGGSTWSGWEDVLADGSIPAPEDTTHIKIRHTLIDNTPQVSSSTVFFDGEAAVETLLTGLQPNAEYDFTQFRDKVLIANGKDLPRAWSGDGEPVLLGGSPPAFQMLETHLNRVWGAGDPENPSRLRYSEILDPDTWPALNFIDFNPEDGDEITAIMRYGQQLVVSKRRTMALLTGDRKSNFTVVWLDHDAGAEGFRGIQIVDKYLAYVARDGIRFSDLTKSIRATERLSGAVPGTRGWERLNPRRLNQAALVTQGNYMLASLPGEGSLTNNQVWFFDVLRAAWSIIPDWKVSCWLKFHQYGEEILLAGDAEKGQVYQVMTGRTDADGSYMEYDFQTKDFDAGVPERYKVFRDCILIVGGVETESPVKVSFIVDGVDHPVPETNTLVPAGDGVVHSIRLIPPVYGAVLGQRISVRVRGRCHLHAIALGMMVRGIVPGVS